MAEGEATPVVEAKRLVERDDEGMSQSYHEIFDTQVSLNQRQINKNMTQAYDLDRAIVVGNQALAQFQVHKKAALEVE